MSRISSSRRLKIVPIARPPYTEIPDIPVALVINVDVDAVVESSLARNSLKNSVLIRSCWAITSFTDTGPPVRLHLECDGVCETDSTARTASGLRRHVR